MILDGFRSPWMDEGRGGAAVPEHPPGVRWRRGTFAHEAVAVREQALAGEDAWATPCTA